MANLYTTNTKQKSSYGWLFIVLLILSFLWMNIFPAASSVIGSYEMGYGNILDAASPNFMYVVMLCFAQALLSWLVFEIVFKIYREILAYRIYSFVVPLDNLKNDSRLFYTYRNLIYGLFINLCFFFPYLYTFNITISVIVTVAMIILYAYHIKKTYSESIIGHFVFKNFTVPLFVFEILIIIFQLWGILAWKKY